MSEVASLKCLLNTFFGRGISWFLLEKYCDTINSCQEEEGIFIAARQGHEKKAEHPEEEEEESSLP